MSKMSELEIKVIEMLEDGYTCSDVAEQLNIPRIWVEDLMNDYWGDEEYFPSA